MCKIIYLASEIPLLEIPFDTNSPTFYVEKLANKEEISKKFSMSYQYSIGSEEGCCCMFSYDKEFAEDLDDRERFLKHLKYVKQLIAYILKALEKTSEIELYYCWIGDEDLEYTEAKVSLKNFMLNEKNFELPLNTLLHINCH